MGSRTFFEAPSRFIHSPLKLTPRTTVTVGGPGCSIGYAPKAGGTVGAVEKLSLSQSSGLGSQVPSTTITGTQST